MRSHYLCRHQVRSHFPVMEGVGVGLMMRDLIAQNNNFEMGK
jgi:hypothetical protein